VVGDERALACPVNGARCELVACIEVGCTGENADFDAERAACAARCPGRTCAASTPRWGSGLVSWVKREAPVGCFAAPGRSCARGSRPVLFGECRDGRVALLGCGAPGGASDAALAHGLAARDAIDVMIADDLATRRIGAPARRCPSSLARLEAQVPERPRGRGSRSTFCACATSPSRGRGRGVIGRIASFAGGLPLGELACCAGVAGNLQPVCGHPGHRRAERVTLGEERALLDQPRAVRCCERWRARSRALVGERLAGVWMRAVHAGDGSSVARLDWGWPAAEVSVRTAVAYRCRGSLVGSARARAARVWCRRWRG